MAQTPQRLFHSRADSALHLETAGIAVELASIAAHAVRSYGDAKLIRNNQNRRRRGGNNNGPRPQQMSGGNNYGSRLDNRQRGNASQLLEKYRALARDAQQAGDRVTAEYYLQYADHYFRVLGDYREKAPNDGRQRGREFYDDDASGYNANADDAEAGDDGDQDEDRADDRNEAVADSRGDDNRSQWREERGNAGGRNRDGNRDARPDNRNDGRGDGRNEGRNDGRNDGRDRQNWNNPGAPRNRDDGRGEQRQRNDRPRDDNRDERPRERRPEYQRPAPAEAAINDEGPIPGLPGPATLRVKRPVADELAPRAERPARTLRRAVDPSAVIEPAAVVEAVVPIDAVASGVAGDAEAVAPRRRGRPRKIVDAAPVEG
jgi:hypothetical protein